MPNNNSQFSAYQSMLEPWARLAQNAPDVVSLRLSVMPWLMLTNPMKAADEVQRMFSEKQDAWAETVYALSQSPLQLWMDSWQACWSSSPQAGFNKAFINNSRRVAQPSSRRVNANRRRLGGRN